jgi:hypothetical protein
MGRCLEAKEAQLIRPLRRQRRLLRAEADALRVLRDHIGGAAAASAGESDDSDRADAS